ncbi:LytTR family transcriptional regulator DNA-binding domain-containing protein [Lactobacillus equicursoris]|uniref:LytTR family transcriptional regulator DNA-binding domain-containing protein n=1 Tax=Lactobacillus equicursoris TaxID=420645 RepID=UPI0012DEC10C|nr:LytTR family transcriptional regulator DNA-binding domain-containing protein [Lactobacillus equicursoris]
MAGLVNRSLDLALGNGVCCKRLLEYYWQFYYITTTQFPHKLELVTRGTRAEFVGNLMQVLEKTDFLVQVSQSLLVNSKNITSSCFS